MKTVIIHGQSHKGSTYNIAHNLAEKIGGEIIEFFLPKDFDDFCIGCTQCFMKDEAKCPHYAKLLPITNAIDEADVIILASPVYVYHATGAMKALLDHYGYRWMVHRPVDAMFKKQAVVISTAAGAGMKSTNKDMKDSLFFWGVGKIYQYGIAIAATSWEAVKPKKRKAIDSKITSIANKIKNKHGKVTPSLKTKGFFFIMSIMQKNGFNQADIDYWKNKGWTSGKKPWKN